MEEHNGKRRRKKKIISILYRSFRRNSLPPSSSRSFRTQSHWSFITGQCINSGRFHRVHLSRRMCNQFTFHHKNSGLIPGGQNLSKRQTVFFLPVNPMDKGHKDPETIDLEAPRPAQYLHTTWKKHQNTLYGVDIRLAQKKGLKFYQTRSNAIILYNTLSAYCIPKAIKMETGEIICEKSVGVTSAASEDFLERWLDEGIGFRSCSTSRKLPTNPTKPNSNSHNRATPVLTEQTSRSSAQVSSLAARVPILSVERLDKDKDADEHVDADRVRTERPVGG